MRNRGHVLFRFWCKRWERASVSMWSHSRMVLALIFSSEQIGQRSCVLHIVRETEQCC